MKEDHPKSTHADHPKASAPAAPLPVDNPKEGDIVRARLPGAVDMAITNVRGTDVQCEWLDTVGAHHVYTFHKNLLVQG